MANPPNANEELARAVLVILEAAEDEILHKIAKHLNQEELEELNPDDWKVRKLASIRQIQREIQNIIKRHAKDVQPAVFKAILTAYADAVVSVDSELEDDVPLPKIDNIDDAAEVIMGDNALAGFGRTSKLIVTELALATIGKIEGQYTQILRATMDDYRSIIAEVASLIASGTMSRTESLQYTINKFAARGITGFTDKAGRRWNIASYAEMATRAAIANAQVEGSIQRMKYQGKDLVYVSDHPMECELCRPWEGKILSISGENPKYPSVSEARNFGLFHPGCGHKLYAYFDGFSELPEDTEDPEGYKARMKQRYFERGLREWKRRAIVAQTPEAKRRANQKIREWRDRLDEHTRIHRLKRLHHRESARIPNPNGRGGNMPNLRPTNPGSPYISGNEI